MSPAPALPSRDEIDQRFVLPFAIEDGEGFDLAARTTDAKGGIDKDTARAIMDGNRERMQQLQELLYAENRWSLLLIFQGMDASGKDSAIREVFEGINPQGCEVTAFKAPTDKELEHDFLWRCAVRLPERGHIGVFNRSYYEECLIVRVHPEMLQQQKLPPRLIGDRIWHERFEDIVGFERHLERNGTKVVKFFLHVSKEEQRRRFLKRIDEPAKNWKFSMQDIAEREHWPAYQSAYEHVIRHTSSKHAPWLVVPADYKWFARLVISSAIVRTLEQIDPAAPRLDETSKEELRRVRAALEKEAEADAKSSATAGGRNAART